MLAKLNFQARIRFEFIANLALVRSQFDGLFKLNLALNWPSAKAAILTLYREMTTCS